MAIKENYFYIRHWLICSPNYIRYFDGVVYTPHSVNDVHSLLEANNFLLDYKDELMESKSLRLNLFPDIKKHIPDNTDLSLWICNGSKIARFQLMKSSKE